MQTVAAPLLSAFWANMSQGWGLPPIDNLFIMGTPAWKQDQLKLSDAWSPWAPWFVQHVDRWALAYLRHILEYMSGRQPWRGVAGPASAGPSAYRRLHELVGNLTRGVGPAPNSTVPLPSAIPYEWAFLTHPEGAGTRVVYSLADLPLVSTPRELGHVCCTRSMTVR
jgi:hypothetical protein